MASEATSSAEEFLTASIDDYLLALADGIYQAQRQLSQVSVDLQPGQPPVTYQLPKVDFEFKMTFELGKKTEIQETTTSALSQSKGVLRVRPVDGQRSSSGSSRAEAASLIKGSFVAVPGHGGKPRPILATRIERLTGRRYQIEVTTGTAAGEALSGVEVQFNVDHELSRRLNEAQSLAVDLQAGTTLTSGVVATDASGHAVNVLTLAEEEPLGVRVAVLIDALDYSELITFQAEA
jgi:hypothetical protein